MGKKKPNFAQAWINKHMDVHPPVFYPAALLVIAFVTISIVEQEDMQEIFSSLKDAIAENSGWYFVLIVNLFLGFCIWLGFSKFGTIRLGGPGQKPEFSTLGWFAMLFSAGMGIGMIYWSVAEPMYHFTSPPTPDVVPESPEAARTAMSFTFLHWGLHAWAIYALVALSLAFFAYNLNLPLSIRSLFYPLLGNRIYHGIGDFIDVLAVLATLFGLATSLGLGVKQISGGIDYVFGVYADPKLLILLITLMATVSVVLGVDKGVRRLSEITMILGGLLLLFVLAVGPTLFIGNSFVQNIGLYAQNFFHVSFWTETYNQTSWQDNWTVYYWAWWIAWSPFVGMFIARVSRGRTIREFIAGVLLVPTLLTLLWVTVFGGSAFHIELTGSGEIAQAALADIDTVLFKLFDFFPFSMVLSVLGVVMIVGFFVTSSDSGSLVVDSITSGGKLDAPVAQRIFWALAEGAVAAVLLYGGGEEGLKALQTASITTGLPFSVVLLLMCVSLYLGLQKWAKGEYQIQKDQARKAAKD